MWEDDFIQKTNDRTYMLTAHNAGVAQTTVGIDYSSLMKLIKNHNVLDYAKHRHACPKALNMCISFRSESPKHVFKTCASQPH